MLFTAKGLDGEGPIMTAARRTLLLANVGSEHLQEVTNSFYPDDPKTKAYEEIKAVLRELYKPAISAFTAVDDFEAASRQEGETFVQFSNRL